MPHSIQHCLGDCDALADAEPGSDGHCDAVPEPITDKKRLATEHALGLADADADALAVAHPIRLH